MSRGALRRRKAYPARHSQHSEEVPGALVEIEVTAAKVKH
ncbi:hypothetical protein FBZ89_11452 [Nitrospirillum amazonense]|uniref:Uncharacterized protein n=1 Tax=Nitrospirillum amazonense TaxID=28077 RepID=A0A560F1G5_9PROT|nr:hypothetical protein FBZ89_11452 [Nitrospirillum amazonense]